VIRIEAHDEIIPICPHCSEAQDSIWYRELGGMLGRRFVYFCSHCHKVLGVSHRKGFWMG
jgi:hypothetical protein